MQLDPSEERRLADDLGAGAAPTGRCGYQQAGLFVADIDLAEATGLLASRCRTA